MWPSIKFQPLQILIALGLAAIAIRVGQTEIVTMCLITVAAITGFFVFNFPFGAIFLGDGGAYVIEYPVGRQ